VKYITTWKLSELLTFDHETLGRWPASDKPLPVTIMHTPHYAYDEVNKWLAAPMRAFGFKAPPTLEQLISGELRLMRRNLATTLIVDPRIAHPSSYMQRKINAGLLPALRLQKQTWLLSVAGVEAFLLARKKVTEGYSYKDLEQILGSRRDVLLKAVNAGRLERVPGTAPNGTRITHRSLLAYLQEVLPKNTLISPEEWIMDREESKEPLVSAAYAGEQLGYCVDETWVLLNAGELQHIRSFSGKAFWVSPDSIAAYKERQAPLTTHQKAAIFGVSSHVIAAWHRTDLLKCPLHRHDDPKVMYRWCMVAFLQPLCSPGLDAARWINRQLKWTWALWQEDTTASHLGCEVAALTAAGDKGELTYITTPTGKRVYVRNQIKKRR
jgi:hypothetical protein